jgi:hypothetical protein
MALYCAKSAAWRVFFNINKMRTGDWHANHRLQISSSGNFFGTGKARRAL